MATPLRKRLPREFKNNLGRYLGMILLMVMAIALTSGFLVSATSIQVIDSRSRDTYNVEDGRFTTNFEADDESIAAVEALGATVYKLFYADMPLTVPGNDTDITVRVFENRTEVDLPAYIEGQAPAADNEIALNRNFCDNLDLDLGDTVQVAGEDFVLVGKVSLPDQVTTFRRNTDFIFNSLQFCVAQVTSETYERIAASGSQYNYAFVLDDRDMALVDRISFESDLAEALSDNGEVLTDLVDWEGNQGIVYATDDVEGDILMWEVLLMLLIVIMAFVFVVLTNANIEEESSVIGTLLASGYRKRELIFHYMTLPLIVGIVGCVAGTALGRLVFVEPMKNLYYNSYCFPPFEQHWNTKVFLITSVVPFVLLVGITLGGLLSKMNATPLQFLRHEIGRRSKSGGVRLPDWIPFPVRFRLRVFTRNWTHFLTLFFGIAFGSLLLLFGFCMMPLVQHNADTMAESVAAEHVYTLKAPLEIDGTDMQRESFEAAETLATTEDLSELNPDDILPMLLLSQEVDQDANPVNIYENSQEAIDQAEKFAATTLEVDRRMGGQKEETTVYGIQPESRYWDFVKVSSDGVDVGAGLAKKCGLEEGSTYEFYDKYEDKSYSFTVEHVVGAQSDMATYMRIDSFNQVFDQEPDNFNGYASDLPLNFDDRYLVNDLTPESMQGIADQMSDSMGSIANMMIFVAVPIYLVLIYLLTKTVIDRNARAISYMKVFGYHDPEVSKLYVRSITVTVLVSLVLCIPLLIWALTMLVDFVFMSYAGNLEMYIQPLAVGKELALGVVTYAVVAFLHVRAIRKVPLALAMKAAE